MAKPEWVSTSPSSGSGNGSVAVGSTAEHTGRVARSGNITFTAASVTPIEVAVNQAGKPEFITAQESAAAGQTGQTVTLSGTSNSSIITFSLGSGDLVVELPTTYIANSVSTANGEAIAGDPGAAAQFAFSISIVVPANEGVDEISRQIIATDNGGNTAIVQLTQAAGDATLSVSPLTIELDYLGTTQAVTVTSNTSWVVS